MENLKFYSDKIRKFGIKNFILERILPFSLGAVMIGNIFVKGKSDRYDADLDSVSDEEMNDVLALGEERIVSGKQYRASDYYFVYIQGNIYLTTEKNIIDNENILSEYYNVVDNKLVGFVRRENKKIDYLSEDFKGVGFGREIPPVAVIPVKDMLVTDSFDEDVFNYFTSNSKDLLDMLDNRFINSKEITTSDDAINNNPYTELIEKDNFYESFSGSKVQKFTLYNKNFEKIVAVGVRFSANEYDCRYDYIYDYLTGNIYLLSSKKYSHIITESVDLTKTIVDLKKFSDVCYNIDDLYIFDTTLGNVTSVVGEKQDFYYLIFNEMLDDEGIGKSYKDALCDNSFVYTYDDAAVINYYNYTDNVFIDVKTSKDIKTIVPMTEFLRAHGLDPLIQDNLSKGELNDIMVYIEMVSKGDSKTIDFETRPDSLNLSVKDEEAVMASDLVVIDPMAEGITITGNDYKKYYFVRFEKVDGQDDVYYADIYDKTGLAVISKDKEWMFYTSTEVRLDGSVVNIQLPFKDNDMGVRNINEFLEEKGLSDLIKEKYTGRDIANIYEYVMNNNLENVR